MAVSKAASTTQQKMVDLEDKHQVIITAEDCNECSKFFEFFEIPVPLGLRAALDAFIKTQSYANQSELRFQLAHTVSFSDHAVFKDEVFAQVRPETKEVAEELIFEREFDKALSSDSK